MNSLNPFIESPVTLTVEEWLSVREYIAQELKTSGSGQQKPTRITIAEKLMQAGIIDVPAVLHKINEMAAALEKDLEEDE